jgi:hypothetical protein
MTKHTWAEALDSEDKGFNKCSTQADKYLTLRLFRIATPADDPDALHSKDSDYEADFDKRTEGQKRIAQYQVHAFNEACANNGKTPEMITAYLKTKFHHVQVEQLMRSEFAEALQWANNKGDLEDNIVTSIRAANGRRASKSVEHATAVRQEFRDKQATGD